MRNFVDYISRITFRFIKPHTPWLPMGFARFTPWRRFGTALELANTKIPYCEGEMKTDLRKICDIPRMSTFAIGAIVNEGVSVMKEAEVFVNVGVWHGFTLLSGMVNNARKRCIGVDDFSEFGGPRKAFLRRFNSYKRPNHEFYEMHYLDYFSNAHEGKIGFYLYDGNHSYEDQISALRAAEPFFSERCLILIDDANYSEVREAAMDFISSSSHEYRTLLDRTTFCNHHPTFWNGIMILRRID
jgi:hypothetical protein